MKVNKQTIDGALTYGFPNDKIKIRYKSTSLTLTRNRMHHDLDFLKKVLWIVDLTNNKHYWINTKDISAVEVEIFSHDPNEDVAKVGEI